MDEQGMRDAVDGLLELAACGDAGEQFADLEDLEIAGEASGALTVTLADGSAFAISVQRIR